MTTLPKTGYSGARKQPVTQKPEGKHGSHLVAHGPFRLPYRKSRQPAGLFRGVKCHACPQVRLGSSLLGILFWGLQLSLWASPPV